MSNRRPLSVFAMFALAASLLSSSFVAAQATSPPPQPLRQQADGHWSPYDAPETLPDDPSVTIYTVAAGDWLSKIAQDTLGDWRLWPQIWERNLWVTDSHWIYPGDKIVIPAAGAGLEDIAVGDDAMVGSVVGGDDMMADDLESVSLVGEPVPAGSENDIYCFGYVSDDDDPEFPRRIVSGEELTSRLHYVEGDIVYIDGGSADDVKAGDQFFIVAPGKMIDDVGRWVHYLGQLRVICVQEKTATAEITMSCSGIEVGAALEPFEALPVPYARRTPLKNFCDPASGKPTGTIVYVKDDLLSFAQDNVILLDVGSAAGFGPGDFVTIYAERDDDLPRAVLGEAALLLVGDDWATARIHQSRQDLWLGLMVEGK